MSLLKRNPPCLRACARLLPLCILSLTLLAGCSTVADHKGEAPSPDAQLQQPVTPPADGFLGCEMTVLDYDSERGAAAHIRITDEQGTVFYEFDVNSPAATAVMDAFLLDRDFLGVEYHMDPSNNIYQLYQLSDGSLTAEYIGYGFTAVPGTHLIAYAAGMPHFSEEPACPRLMIGDKEVYTGTEPGYALREIAFSEAGDTIAFLLDPPDPETELGEVPPSVIMTGSFDRESGSLSDLTEITPPDGVISLWYDGSKLGVRTYFDDSIYFYDNGTFAPADGPVG